MARQAGISPSRFFSKKQKMLEDSHAKPEKKGRLVEEGHELQHGLRRTKLRERAGIQGSGSPSHPREATFKIRDVLGELEQDEHLAGTLRI